MQLLAICGSENIIIPKNIIQKMNLREGDIVLISLEKAYVDDTIKAKIKDKNYSILSFSTINLQ